MSLVAPDTTGWTVIPDPNPNASWTPSLDPNTDYVLTPKAGQLAPRDHQIIIQGGRNVYIKGFYTTRADTNGGPNFMIDGGDNQRYVFFHGVVMDCVGGEESDGIRTRKSVIDPSSGKPGQTDIKMLDCRIIALRGQTSGSKDDLGNPSAATHADCIQLAGGSGDIILENCTLHSRYSCLQLQQEQVETGSYGKISALSRVGATATLTTSAAHGLITGDFIQVGNGVAAGGTDCTPNSWNGTYMVTRTSSTTLTYNLGDSTPSAFTNANLATWKESLVQYRVGDVSLTNVNLVMDHNQQQYLTKSPDETLNAIRVGGRPDYKGYEDQTPMTSDAWTGSLTLSNVYIQTYTTGAGGVCNPGSGGRVYSLVRGNLSASVWTWPSWPAVTGQINVGTPPGGDFCPAWLPGLGYPNTHLHRVV